MATPADLVLAWPIEPGDAVVLADRVRSLLADGERDAVVCDATALSACGLDGVALLATLQLTARRMGGRVEVRNASSQLHALLAMAGLCGVVGVCEPSGLEAGRQAEHREEAGGIQEEGDTADPVA
jgi:ABC-type transporter Mla MlaB component